MYLLGIRWYRSIAVFESEYRFFGGILHLLQGRGRQQRAR
jgi:hypothetical protein